MKQNSDLAVKQLSHSLENREIDVIVSGSIGAVESVRFVRSLRRLGANTRVYLTKGAQQFVTETALEWASAAPVISDFRGLSSHLAAADACVVAPASANFIRKIAQGITDSPSSALVASYLGAKKPVIVVPNMHDSLSESPIIKQNLEMVSRWTHLLAPRQEEGKQKFPKPEELADQVSHLINLRPEHVLVAYGSTKAYIDDIRYITNYSSGSLGMHICNEFYRHGFDLDALVGSCKYAPHPAVKKIPFATNEDLEKLAHDKSGNKTSVVFLASVSDYIPNHREPGKIRSGRESMSIELIPTKKIISSLPNSSGVKVGFKLEAHLEGIDGNTVAKDYMEKYDLSMFVLNSLDQVGEHTHRAQIFYRGKPNPFKQVDGKQGLAQEIVQHTVDTL